MKIILILLISILLLINSISAIQVGTVGEEGVNFKTTTTSTNYSTTNTNSSTFWGIYNYLNYNMPSILSFAYNHTLVTYNLYNSIWSSTYNSSYVPYTGATSNIDLGNKNLTTTGTINSTSAVLTGTSAGNTITTLRLKNNHGSANTGVSMDFTTSTSDAVFGRITTLRIGAGGNSNMIFSTLDDSALTEKLRITTKNVVINSSSIDNAIPSLKIINTGGAVTASFLQTATTTSVGGAGMAGIADDGEAMDSGHRLGYFAFGGAYDTTHTYVYPSATNGFATETWNSTNQGADLRFLTTRNGATVVAGRATRWTITNDGNFVSGTDGTTANNIITTGNIKVNNINATNTINTQTNFSVNNLQGLTRNITIVKSVDLVGLTKVMCDMNFTGGILTSSNC